jgi:hypothetical protein
MVGVYDGCEKMLTVLIIVVAFEERRKWSRLGGRSFNPVIAADRPDTARQRSDGYTDIVVLLVGDANG